MKALTSPWHWTPTPAARNPARGSAWEDFITPGRFAALLGLFILAAYPDVVVGSRSFFYRDYGMFGLPLAHYFRTSFWNGEVPLWNPLNNCGLPFLAQWNTMVFYPLSLAYVFLPLPWALNYFCLGHLFIAGVTMYALARSWTGSSAGASVAGLAFALNGLSLHALMWPNNIAALAWMPLVILTVERAWNRGGRAILLAAAIAALQMLAGAPEIILFTWLILAGLWLGRWFLALVSTDIPPSIASESKASEAPVARPQTLTGRLLAVVGLVGGLVAVQIWPFIDLLFHSQRTHQFGNSVWAMPGWGWANFIVPLFHCSVSRAGVYSQDDQQWTSSYYIGIGVLALALVAILTQRQRRVYFLALVALLSAIMALGDNAFLFTWLRELCPAIGFGRFPIKFIVPAMFALPLLAAYAVARIGSGRFPTRSLLMVALIFSGLIVGLLWFAYLYPIANENWQVTARSGISRAGFLVGLVGLIYCWPRLTKVFSPLVLMGALLALVGADALTHTPRQNPTVDNWVYDFSPAARLTPGNGRAMVSPKFQKFLEYAGNPDPVAYCLGHRRAMLANWNLLRGASVLNGFYSLYPREQHQVGALLYGRGEVVPQAVADFAGASQISSDEELFSWVARPTALPMVMIGQRPIFGSDREVLSGLTNFNPREVVYLPREAMRSVTATNASAGRVIASRFRAQQIDIDIEAAETALVTVAQTYYHHWRAELDGRPIPIWRANHGFQAVEVPAGKHRITLRYQDDNFRAGALVSSATLLFMTGAAVRRRRNQP